MFTGDSRQIPCHTHRTFHHLMFYVKESQFAAAEVLFQGTGINISTTGERYLGAPIASTAFAKQFIAKKIDVFIGQLEKL